jgi:hypothetical protein
MILFEEAVGISRGNHILLGASQIPNKANLYKNILLLIENC